MNKVIVFCIFFLLTIQIFPADAMTTGAMTSELSHAAGGAVISGVATAIANKYWPEHRALIGFTVGAAAGVIGELAQNAAGNGKFSALDAASNALGALIGTLITDKYILKPVVKQQSGSSYIGVAAQINF